MNPNIKPKDNPYKIPDNYFNELEKSIFSKTISENNKEDNLFNTPDFYFEKLENSILSKTIKSDKETKENSIFLFTKNLYWVSTAACILFALWIGVYFFHMQVKKDFISLTNDKNNKSKADSPFITKDKTDVLADVNLPLVNKNTYVVHSAKTPKNQNKEIISNKTKKENFHVQEINSSKVIYDLYFNPDEDTLLSEEEMWSEEF